MPLTKSALFRTVVIILYKESYFEFIPKLFLQCMKSIQKTIFVTNLKNTKTILMHQNIKKNIFYQILSKNIFY